MNMNRIKRLPVVRGVLFLREEDQKTGGRVIGWNAAHLHMVIGFCASNFEIALSFGMYRVLRAWSAIVKCVMLMPYMFCFTYHMR